MTASRKYALELALESNFDSVSPHGKLGEYDVFVAKNKGSEITTTGYPPFILANKRYARFATSDEMDKLMGFIPIGHTDYKGEDLL